MRFMKFFRVINSLLVGSFLLSMPTLGCAATLEHLIQLALESHPDVQASRILRGAAARDIASARWQFYPTVTGVSTSNNDRSFLGDDCVANVGIVQPLWAGGSLTSNLDVAKVGFKQSGAEIDQAEQELALRVLGIYVDWYSANLWVKSWQQSQITHQRLPGQVQRRTLGGASSESDTALAEARVAITEADLAGAIAEEQAALAVLTQLVGKSLFLVDLADHYAPPVDLSGDLSGLSLAAQDKNPIVIAALAEVELAQARVGAVRAKYMPEVNLRLERLNGNIGFADSNSSNRVFLELTSRFGAGLSRRSDASAARLRRDAALASVESQRQTLASNIDTDLALKASIEQRLVALANAQRTTQAVYAFFERQSLSGSRTWLDLLSSVLELTQLELRIADVRGSQIQVSWRLSILSRGLNSVLGDN
ncbi:MAG: adhesin transport system outer membrane protein [Saprospiraceae bacterium]